MFIRALIFFFGLLMLSTGISVITHAGLGTGTISSVALVLSKALPLSMGFFVFLTNVFFFVLQTAVDPSRFLVKLVKDRKSTRQNSSHGVQSRMPSSA